MTDRMTDERLTEIQVCWEDTPEWNWEAIAQELIQALKAEREYVKELEDEMPSIAGAVGASMYGKRIRELKEIYFAGQENLDHAINENRKAKQRIRELEEAHRRNVDSQHRNFKHQEESHRCGWRVMYEAVVARSKEALADD